MVSTVITDPNQSADDQQVFRASTDRYRRELLVHCYRMLGSLQDAEDAVQETLVSAWRGLPTFEERSSIRTWLYRIATNCCLNARRAAGRRPAKAWDVPGVEPLEPTRLGEVVWLEPLPDAIIAGTSSIPVGPEARYEQREAISLAFVTALQVLPPRQTAVLVLRDVLGFSTNEVVEMLESSPDSINSALKRARASLRLQHRRPAGDPPPITGSPEEAAVLQRFVAAWESADIEALVALLTDDAFIAMPPMPFEYEGRELVGRFCANIFAAGRRFELVPTRANGQPAFGAYLRNPSGISHAIGLFVLALSGDGVQAMLRFENSVLASFDLPSSVPGITDG